MAVPVATPATAGRRPCVLVIGAGFGGLAATRALRKVPVDVTLVDQHNYHLFQPLLYQVASSLLNPSEIAYPVRASIRRCRNAHFRLARVDSIDLEARRVITGSKSLEYDYVIVAAGAVTNFFGIRSVEERAFGLKGLGEALALRNHLLQNFERAEWTDDPAERRRLQTIALVGGGATGVELAGAFSELIQLVLRKDFPDLDLSTVRIVLLEGTQTVLSAFRPRLQRAAVRTLERKGIELRWGAIVREVRDDSVVLASGETIPTGTVVWTAGVRASDLGATLGVPLSHQGRVPVGPTLQLRGHPEVFVIGDLAEAHQGGEPLPMLAPVAMQQGRHVAATIAGLVRGAPPRPFHYFDKGTMATIGRNSGIAQTGPLSFTGFAGWVAWLAVHLVLLIGFRNRLVALLNWGWDYFFYDRPVRLIATPARLETAATESTDSGGEPAPLLDQPSILR